MASRLLLYCLLCVAAMCPPWTHAAVTQPGALGEPVRAGPDATAPFRTRYASFEPASFSELPGWRDDKLGDALAALRQSCAALQKKSAWEQPCRRAGRIAGSDADDATLRLFFEQEFRLYQIREPSGTPAGVITGYYEPLLNGSRRYGAPYLYPVHAVPDDLLYLDARSLPAGGGDGVMVRIDGRNVIPLAPSEAGSAGAFRLDLAGVQPDIRTKRYRVRLDGQRVAPYFSRDQIERGEMARARVIVWVDDPAALYSMQIQGSGKIRLPDGGIVRVSYGEQNGHPFRPSLQALPQQTVTLGKRRPIVTRGLEPPTNDVAQQPEPQREADGAPLTRGLRQAPPPAASRAEVDRMIAALLPGAQPGVEQHQPQPQPPPAPERHKSAPRKAEPAETEYALPGPAAPVSVVANSDPSYVFFRTIPDSENGPIGALGVPLTAGRSVAVDPRTTPLGAPVFISTREPGRSAPLNRLMLAQDTGGAIRGAVRADYFWGFGAQAFMRASQMKEDGRMWLLLPNRQQLAARSGALLLRGGAGSQAAECVVPDPELCVE
jgi:membrane-bound lytic murein transglycosylase A